MRFFTLPISPATRTGFRALRSLVLEHRLAVLLGLGSLLTTDLCQLFMPQVLGNGIDTLFGPDGGPEKLRTLLITFGLLVLFAAIFRYLWRHFFFTAARRTERDLRARIFDRLLTLSPSYYQRIRTGDLMSLLISDLEAVRMTLAIGMVTAFDAIVYTGFSLAAILIIAPKLALICLIPFPFIVLAVLYFDHRIEDRYDEQQNQISRLTEKVREGFSAVRLIKAYARESEETARLARHSQTLVEKSIALARLQSFFMPLITTLAGLSMALLIGFGGPAAIRGELSDGALIKFLFYLGLLAWPMMAVGWTVTIVLRGCVSMSRLQTLLDEVPAIRDPESPAALDGAAPATLEAADLGFTYPGAAAPALTGVSFSLLPGDHLGIIGPVGAGKSTLLGLLQRYHDPATGEIRLGGIQLQMLPLNTLRGLVAPVTQEAFLFSMSLADNILLGREGDAAAAAKTAALGGELHELPDGLATLVGEKGITLSGGQKQRAALSRALVRPPPILLLDDTLSAVDAETESRLIASLRSSLQGRSVVIVAHRISAVAHCDEIIVLDEGRVVERGTHATLMENNGPYARIARLQRLEGELQKSA